MTVYEIVGGVVLLIVSLVILVLTLLQHTHGQGLSSAIGGGVQGANTTRLSPADQMLAKVTADRVLRTKQGGRSGAAVCIFKHHP